MMVQRGNGLVYVRGIRAVWEWADFCARGYNLQCDLIIIVQCKNGLVNVDVIQ